MSRSPLSAPAAISPARNDGGSIPARQSTDVTARAPPTQSYEQSAWMTYKIKSATVLEIDKTRLRFVRENDEYNREVKLPNLLRFVPDTVERHNFAQLREYNNEQRPARLQNGQVHTVPVIFTVTLAPKRYPEITQIKYDTNVGSGGVDDARRLAARPVKPGTAAVRNMESHEQRRRRLRHGASGSRR